ncbi:MAG TPA: hypothetical protein PK514_15760 [Spirochaetota bacterium]|nr:hypothetical protein [Spirochaetota bacterium]
MMQTLAKLTPDDLKLIIKQSIKESLSEKKLKDIFHEVIEDIALARAVDEGMKTENIDKKAFVSRIKSRV